jgi:UDP-2,4-diacetamido-2,4,6-trideoxy-beta-L-altropyranose hydrolase
MAVGSKRMTSQVLLIRADATVAMGTGHVMRCLALAQACQDAGGSAIFAVAEITVAAEERICAEGMKVARVTAHPGSPEDAIQLAELAHREQTDWVVVDGYQFGTEYQQSLKRGGLKVLFLDDYGHAQHYYADLVLNQNPNAAEALYNERERYTTLLLGSRFAMLRREFASRREWQREVTPVARKVLVTLGGSDPDNVTTLIIESLGLVRVAGLETIIVIGGSNPHGQSVERAACLFPGKVQLLKDVSNMAELMAWAELAVSAGGGTCYELALLQVPMVLITMAKNQEATCRVLGQCHAAIDAGWFHVLNRTRLSESLGEVMVDQEYRRALLVNARKLVDGDGSRRVVERMAQVQVA